jgi:hypothetical protein
VLVLVFGERESFVSVVGMWESRRFCEVPKGPVERAGKLGLLFRAFHGPRHFHNAGLFGRRLPLQRGSFETIAVMTGLDDVSLIGDAIHQCLA